ncbi:hypothetical protein [uncultured Tessaracoccus sp.]|uniref:hypothetical protein n=1 Tax=uncultured Tessaracoccus sp. TaxID=905023 RepID=UPI00260048E4|nr:hypothetical protein [uncultured Tessaracoccus sp.]
MTIFTPSSWQKAGSAIRDAGTTFGDAVRGRVDSLENTGADGGIAMIDEIIAGVLPAVMEAVNETIDGIEQGLGSEGEAAVATGDAYEEVEDAAAEIGAFDEGEYY